METVLTDLDRSWSAAVLAILNDAIVHSTALWDYAPRPLDAMAPWFAAKEEGRYPVIGAVDGDGHLLGFATYGPFRARPAYRYTVEHSVYVDRHHRRLGLGIRLLTAVVERARQQQYHTLIGGSKRPMRQAWRCIGGSGSSTAGPSGRLATSSADGSTSSSTSFCWTRRRHLPTASGHVLPHTTVPSSS